MNYSNKQVRRLWELYATAGSKDAAFSLASQEADIFPDGITRQDARDILARKAPVGFFHEPKILFLDIETAPFASWVWKLWREDITDPAQIISDWYLLSWAAAWGDGDIMQDDLAQHKPWKAGKIKDDSPLLKSLWGLLDDADIVVAHNGDKFDVPKINTRFLGAKLPPPSPYQTVDTLQVARKKFHVGSNSLASLARFLGLNPKGKAGGWETWAAAADGNLEAMARLGDYNKDDIRLLREVYYRVRAWAPSHPNFGVIANREQICPVCGSDQLTEGHKPYRTPAGSYVTWSCNSCGASSRERTTAVPKSVRKGLLVPLAR